MAFNIKQIYSDRYCLSFIIKDDIVLCKCEYSHRNMVKNLGFTWNGNAWKISRSSFDANFESIRTRLSLCPVMCREYKGNIQGSPNPMPEISSAAITATNILKIRPYQYQIEGIDFAIRNPYCIIGDEMGLGKTPQGIGVLAAFAMPSIVVCPASLKHNWQAEIEKFYDVPTYIIEGNTTFDKKKNNYINTLIAGEWPIIFIINFEIMHKFEFLFKLCKHWIVDEAHALKTITAKRTKTFEALLSSHRPRTCTFLTGTAITSSVVDFFSLLKFCSFSPKANGIRLSDDKNFSSYLRFAEYFSHSRQTSFGTQYKGIRHFGDLRELLKHKYLRRSAQDYLPDLPALTRAINICYPEPEKLALVDDGLKAAYEMLKNGMAFDNEHNIAIASAKRGSASLKANYTAEIALNIVESNEKVIIFSDHVEACEIIKNKIGDKAFLIIGATKMETRQKICERFQDENDTDCMAIVATYGALATGRTLTQARITLANDLPWVPSTYLQAEKRFHRIGQTQKCLVKIISCKGFDSLINRNILDKALTLNMALSQGRETPLSFGD